ncbi:myosin-G heavy chain [Sabethes cyaneus]|uniref:myosin-G heavy chain n=1 Tax=Sabethes cyaneus TaxID=53552 RepID=UPI00237E905A|nr:myosin-G heavy chain [Sabethes cyaneus]XP_053689154.1 myosin-G heavy chain [Sabethes cyaneus]XP_053689155.1 myosin-G heavy chain [Sabethes cyaneus]XP_053689156.1 myosin-G heavy chain [Sabethes cyaneus]
MSTNSPGTPKKCRLILQQCLAIQLTKPGNPPEDFWMYDSGYTIFQNFLSANLQCWWNAPLAAATKVLKYLGHISPGMLLITAEPCALEIIRSAYARSVLKPPATYLINSVGDIDDCIVTPIVQTQFTPLTEALCDVIMELTAQGQSATIENIRSRLRARFTHMQQPSVEVIYDTLVQLMQEIKIYQTSKGYFIVTPEKRRSKSKPIDYSFASDESTPPQKESKTLLMSSHEALRSLYGEISTERDGDQTHQCIQTNLADVICGGNPNDKILYPRSNISKQRSASLAGSAKTLERRHSLRLFGSSKRLQRSASTRSLSKNYSQTIAKDNNPSIGNSSSSENQSNCDTKKQASSPSLLSRIFRRSTRSKSKSKQIETYSAQFPPPEWFNSKTTHLHSVGTQTIDYLEVPIKSRLMNSTFYDSSDVSQRSLSLPRRRHHRRNLSSESTFFISSRDCSPVRRGKSPSYYCGSLPRSIHSTPASSGYYKVSRSKQLSSAEKLHSNSQNKIENKASRVGSGPSSIDSGKMTYITSGPSSFDSEKLSSTRTSTHSSLESHVSAATVTTTIQQTTTSSYFIANDTKPSYVNSNGSKDNPPSAVTTTTTNSSKSNQHYKGFETTFGYNNQAINTSTNNHSNSSTNNNSNLVKNSFNALCNEVITNNGILTNTNSSNLIKLETELSNGSNEMDFDQLSALNGTLLNFKLNSEASSDVHELNKYNKNINKQENTPMNNSKTLPSTPPVQPANFFYKNVLKNIQHDAKNICGDLATDKDLTGSMAGNLQHNDHQSNLRRSNSEIKKLNSNLDLKNQICPSEKISGLIVMKKSLSVSSEPNLTNQMQETNKITILVKDSDKPNNSDRRFSFQNKEDPMIEEMYDFPSLTDLSFNFTSLAAQKILQGDASLNSIDTLVELNINQEKQQTIMKLKNDARTIGQQAQDPSKIVTDFGMV